MNEGSTDFWLSLLVEFEDGDGDVGSMHIRQVKKMLTFCLGGVCRRNQEMVGVNTCRNPKIWGG